MASRPRDGSAPALRVIPGGAPVSSREPRTSHSRALDDAEILALIARGDSSGAVAFHDRVRPQVERTIGRLLGRRDTDHEDLAQLSLIELVRSLAAFRGECSLDTWTSRVTAHTVFKELRRRRSERRVFDPGIELTEQHASVVDLDRTLTMRSALGRVRGHLDALDPNKAWTVLLHDVCGYDLREIAEITDVSVAAAQTRLVRGRRELHARIEADPELADLISRRSMSSDGKVP